MSLAVADSYKYPFVPEEELACFQEEDHLLEALEEGTLRTDDDDSWRFCTYSTACISPLRFYDLRRPDIVLIPGTSLDPRRVGFLNPLFKTYIGEYLPSKLCDHLELAQEVNRYVHSKIQFSDNYPLRSAQAWELWSRNPHRFRVFNCNIHAIHNSIFFTSHAKSRNIHEAVYNIAALAQMKRVGNCFAMCCVGLFYGRTIANVNVELFRIAGGDHVFLVYGRDPNTNPWDFTSWNPSTVIGCPWSDTAYPAYQLLHNLLDYVGMFYSPDGLIHTLVRPFNPYTQYLEREA